MGSHSIMRAFALLALLAQATCAAADTASPIVGGYFANWAQYHTAPYTYTPSNLAGAVNKLDHIMYAFTYFDPDTYQLKKVEEKDDEFYREVIAFKSQNPNLKVLLSVGGWNFPSAHFSKMSSTAAGRKAFAASCVTVLETYGFDGIDLDWEYPCSPARKDPVKITCLEFRTTDDDGGRCPNDTSNFVALVRDIRTAFTASGKKYMLTVASQSAHKNFDKFDLASMDTYIDYWHVMSYDYTVSDLQDAQYTAPNSPLYTPAEQHVVRWSTNTTVMGYLAAGVTANKIIIGMPLYGHTWYVPGLTGDQWQTFGLEAKVQGLCCGPFKSTYGARYGKGSQLCGTMMYSEIEAAGPEWHYDTATQSMIAYQMTNSPDGWTKAGTWMTYNDATSTKAIAEYTLKHKLAGMFLFDMSMDSMDFTTGQFTYQLTTVVNEVLKGGQPPSHNVCQPMSECNVCKSCCKSYLKVQSDCDACVKSECQ